MKIAQATIARNQRLAWQEVSDKVVVVTPGTRKIHILYDSAFCIWNYLEKPRTFKELRDLLCKEYEVAEDQAHKDIEKFISQLEEKEIVTLM